MKEVDEIAVSGLLHDIGKFGQRADSYRLKEGVFKRYEYKYAHAQYTAQILHDGDLAFNLSEEMIDAAAMHHHPENDEHWILAAADRMASGFEREVFDDYNSADSESYKQQRLWHLFDQSKQFKIAELGPETLFAEDEKAVKNEYDSLWSGFVASMGEIKAQGNSSSDLFTIDYLLKRFTSFIPSSTSFQKGGYSAVKANIPLYEHSKATAIFASVIYKLSEQGNHNIIDYYKERSGDMKQEDMLLIAGDFFGIQKFIFNAVPSAKASKILRAKSAYIQILTKVIAFHIVEELGLSYQSIVSTHAGKFEILGVNDEASQEKLQNIQKELNRFFIKKYFGETGVGISAVPCSLADFIVKDRYKEQLRMKVDMAVENAKFRKFDLNETDPVLNFDEGLDNQNLCQLCGRKKGKEREQNDKTYMACDDCFDFVKIGQNLAKTDFLTISRNSGQIRVFGDHYINFSKEPKRFDNAVAVFDISNDEAFRGYAKWELNSYVKRDDQDEVLTFEELADNSCQGLESGVKAMMALKGDVDSMGAYIKDPKNEVTNSFARFNFFARMVDYFFSVKASQMMKGRDLYTVFAGGDDIFVLGAWDEVIDFAKELRKEFMRFTQGSELTLSVGMIMTKPNKPVNFVADISESALENAKVHKDEKGRAKDAVSLFGETVKWDDYLDEDNAAFLLDEVEHFEQIMGVHNTAFLYRLLELIEMSKHIKRYPENAMWRSKLSYTFKRNVFERLHTKEKRDEAERFLHLVGNMIQNHPNESKMILSEFVYKRRENAN